MTAVLALALCVLFNVPGVGPNADDAPGDVVFGGFIDPVIFLFIGAFIIAQAMITHGLDKRFAFLVLSIPGVAKSTYGVIIAFGVIAASISAFISNTTTAAMLLPIGLGMMGALGGMVKEQSGHRAGHEPAALRHGAYAHDLLRRGRRGAPHAHRHPAEPHRHSLYRGGDGRKDHLLRAGSLPPPR